MTLIFLNGLIPPFYSINISILILILIDLELTLKMSEKNDTLIFRKPGS